MPEIVRPRSRTARLLLATLVACGAGAIGCATGQQLEIKKMAATTNPPANVALYLKVTGGDAQEPVVLTASDFSVSEDGKVLSHKKGKRALLPAKTVVDRFVLVMVDLSGPIVDSEYLPNLREALRVMLTRLSRQARVALTGYDGSGYLPFVGFEDNDLAAGFQSLKVFRPRERESDLWGAFLTGLDNLNEATAKSDLPFKEGTLVLITDRRDRAGKHTREEALDRVTQSPHDVYVVGIGDRVNIEELEPLGKTHASFAVEQKDLTKSIAATTKLIDDKMSQDYVFSYCSRKRGGSHDLEIGIESPKWHGTVTDQFSAKGFRKGACDPKAKVDFKTSGDTGDDGGASAGGEDGSDKASKKPNKKSKSEDDEGDDD